MKTLYTTNPVSASQIIKNGGLVAFPTETVYGLGASARLHESCQKIYQIKGRPTDNPLIIHFASVDQIRGLTYWNQDAEKLFREFSPGPLTVILKKKDSMIFSGNLDTIGCRIPDHPLAIEFLEKSGPVAAPSLNQSGRPSITRFEAISKEFDGKIECVLEGKDPELGIESTVVDLSGDNPTILRPGWIELEEIENVLGIKLKKENSEGIPLAPGMKYSHYAPKGVVVLFFEGRLNDKTDAYIGFDPTVNAKLKKIIQNNYEYSKELYSFFMECESSAIQNLFCDSPQEGPLYHALDNRLKKAVKSSNS